MDHIEEVNSDLTTCKGEQSIVLRTREGGRVVLTNQVHLHPVRQTPKFFLAPNAQLVFH